MTIPDPSIEDLDVEPEKAGVGVHLPTLATVGRDIPAFVVKAKRDGYEAVFIETTLMMRDDPKISASAVMEKVEADADRRPAMRSAMADWLSARAITLGLVGVDGKVWESTRRLRAMARLYTFWHYRDGLTKALDHVPYTSEQAVHAYVRVVLLWARQWDPLTHAAPQEIEFASPTRPEPFGSTSAVAGRAAELDKIALPIIVESDLGELLFAHRREDGRAAIERSTKEERESTALAAKMMVGLIQEAVHALRLDPTLSVLSAYNRMRAYANSYLGGALARIDVAPQTMTAAVQRVVAVVGRWDELSRDERATFLAKHPEFRALLAPMKDSDV